MFEPTKYELEKAHQKQKLVRNDVKCVGKFGMPLIQKQDIDPYMIHFINFTDTKRDDVKNTHKTVHFFTYDWLYDKVYDDYENQLDVLKQYKAVLSPEFSITRICLLHYKYTTHSRIDGAVHIGKKTELR